MFIQTFIPARPAGLLKPKKLLSLSNDAPLGSVDLNTGDMTLFTTKPSGAVPGVRTPGIRTCTAQQGGYIAPPHPKNRIMAILSNTGKGKVSRLVAAEGQENVGRVVW